MIPSKVQVMQDFIWFSTSSLCSEHFKIQLFTVNYSCSVLYISSGNRYSGFYIHVHIFHISSFLSPFPNKEKRLSETSNTYSGNDLHIRNLKRQTVTVGKLYLLNLFSEKETGICANCEWTAGKKNAETPKQSHYWAQKWTNNYHKGKTL